MAIAQGRCLVGVNTSDNDFKTPEKTGGSKTITVNFNHTHAQTHAFTVKYNYASGLKYQDGETTVQDVVSTQRSDWLDNNGSSINNPKAGPGKIPLGDKTWNNLQPYLCVYIFKRTA